VSAQFAESGQLTELSPNCAGIFPSYMTVPGRTSPRISSLSQNNGSWGVKNQLEQKKENQLYQNQIHGHSKKVECRGEVANTMA
jgi:hypothetical protein